MSKSDLSQIATSQPSEGSGNKCDDRKCTCNKKYISLTTTTNIFLICVPKKKKNYHHKEYKNDFVLTRIFFFKSLTERFLCVLFWLSQKKLTDKVCRLSYD